MAKTEKYKALLPWLLIVGLWAVLHGVLLMTLADAVLDGRLLGPDEYMRLVRVAELRDGGAWYDSVIARSNAPYGDMLHWTRPFDFLILLLATFLSAFTGAANALFLAGVAISPLLGLISCFAIAWAAAPLLGRNRAILAAFIFLIQPGVLAYTAAGRSDHHGLLFLVSALAIGGTIRTTGLRPTMRDTLITGGAYGMAIWASVELTVLIALCQAGAAISWIRFRQISARPQLVAAVAFFAATLMALLAERAPATILSTELDRLSIPYLVIAALVAAVWTAAWFQERRGNGDTAPWQRLFTIGAAGSIGGIALLALFPEFLGGPYAAVDPRIVDIWHKNVAELRPLAPTDLRQTAQFVLFLGTVAICLPYAMALSWRNEKEATAARWSILILVTAGYFALSLQHFRAAPFAEIASVLILADMIGRLFEWSESHPSTLRRVFVTCVASFTLMFGSVLAGSYLLSLSANESADAPVPECRISKITSILNDPSGLGAKPLTIAALLDRGPEILYRTKHSVISAPYHRNGTGIWDSHQIFATFDEKESRAIVSRRGVDLLILCPSSAERRFFDHKAGSKNLYSRLLDGDVPDWLTPVATKPENPDGFRLYRVVR